MAYQHFKEFGLPLDIDYKSYSLMYWKGCNTLYDCKKKF